RPIEHRAANSAKRLQAPHHCRYQATCGPAPRDGRSRTAGAFSRASAAQRWHKQAGARCDGEDSNDFISSTVFTIEGQCALYSTSSADTLALASPRGETRQKVMVSCGNGHLTRRRSARNCLTSKDGDGHA